ncbi:MAG: type I-C CRISPR-associated endonuclease Cas1 [Candidatus Aminicenantes bacterium]|nr:type I-C CRISPR-associated endonuclease Cas1 [Candidatus Aminicenantes bacterium]
MKKLLNTLFVTTDGAYIKKEGESIVVTAEKQVKLRLPIHNLNGIVCFGRVICSPALLGFCGQRGVAVSFLSENGRFLARVHGITSGNVLLRREQYRRAESHEQSAVIAKAFVFGKIFNCRTSLQRVLRDHPQISGGEAVQAAINHLSALLEEVKNQNDLNVVRGSEGHAAQTYFSVLDHLVTMQKEDFYFRGRNRRPPRDNLNALLSFVYTLLLHDVLAALESVGLDPAVGFLHRDRPGRPSLALDMMEEFRPLIADRLALALVNLRQVQNNGFSKTEAGGVLMSDGTRKTVLVAYQKRKQEEINHPFLEEQIPLGMLFFAQALLLARFLRGDLDGYPPFFWK